ncbi:formylglycine-generating enzyme family protein [Lichenibacterium ramalinae]|uniref:Formylglycine-generating enzyme family protein n=1 Tax=Lichenibacterium ramalinae TaxID=2316527 RepID=A0A4Q2RD96_9HYPH|nr:SUMF1/EgtB/PvdO family nonheme iron enzyme [Lichenibacterium ramalinae]RYB05217.1 formylglycine-generating enzyme family protein [Lichenibacterium ramalinae]
MRDDDVIELQSDGFLRGSPLCPNEQPVRLVRLAPFRIDRYPVTNRQFQRVLEAGLYQNASLWSEAGWAFIQRNRIGRPNYWNDDHWNQPSQPVTGISWWEALAYSHFMGKTLPTEAQWEYAAGFGKRRFPWGDAEPTPEHANYAPGCEPAELNRRSMPVDHYSLNIASSGCRDMAGNLGEWCIDNTSPDYSWDTDGRDPVHLTHENAPHIVRGGSGLHDEDSLRCASRDYYSPTVRDNIVGFRCVSHAP